MVIARKYLFIFLLAVPARAAVVAEVTPRESSGYPITLRFTLRDEPELTIDRDPPGGNDWLISGPQQITSGQFIEINGERKTVSVVTLTYLLTPLRKGQLTVPSARILVGGKVYSSPEVKVQVTRLASDPRTKRPQARGPNFPVFPLEEEAGPPPIDLSGENRKLEVAVVAEPSKTEVFAGELILLPFYIYTNENIFSSLEFAAFPTFKDFIKEELNLPKSWRHERVQYRGANFYRAEIIRFALFPLKDGELLIDPLKMRFELNDDIFGIDVREHFFGQDPQKRAERTLLRSSGTVPILVKPLPPKPAGLTQNEIAVGQYSIKVRPPTSELIQNEAFTLKIRVEGTGNIKGIPEPKLQMPLGLQQSKTETDYAINKASEGYKDFDVLLVPRQSGNLVIPEENWTYFDPNKKTYETIPMPSIELRIAPSNKRNTLDAGPGTKDIVYSGAQDFERDSAPVVPLWAWAVPGLMYAAAGLLFVQRRKHEREEALVASMPWILIERKIYAQQDLSSNEALGLVEEWILRRFRVLNIEEAAFHDLTETLRKKLPPGSDAKVDKLKERFRQIENARFIGRKTNSLNLSFNDLKKLTEEIIFSAQTFAQSVPRYQDDEDEDS